MSMNPIEGSIEDLFEVNHIQSVISLLIFLDCTFAAYTLNSYKIMHSKLPIFWNPVKNSDFVLFYFFCSLFMLAKKD